MFFEETNANNAKRQNEDSFASSGEVRVRRSC